MTIWSDFFMNGGGGNTITPGTPVVIQSAGADNRVAAVALSTTKVVVIYSTSTATRAMVLDISGRTITTNTAVDVRAATSTYVSIDALSSTQAIVAFDTQTMVLDISGSTITTNAATTITNATNSMAVATVSSTVAFCLYQNSSTSVRARTLNIAGSAITQNAETTLNTAPTSVQLKASYISSTAMLVGYVGNSNLYMQVPTLTGTSITANAQSIVSNASFNATEMFGIVTNNTSKGFVSYRDATLGGLYGRILTLGSTSVTVGSASTIFAGATGMNAYEGLAKANTDQVVSIYANVDVGSAGYGVVIDDASSININTATLFESGEMRSNALARMTDTKFLAMYIDGGNSNYPTACVLDIT